MERHILTLTSHRLCHSVLEVTSQSWWRNSLTLSRQVGCLGNAPDLRPVGAVQPLCPGNRWELRHPVLTFLLVGIVGNSEPHLCSDVSTQDFRLSLSRTGTDMSLPQQFENMTRRKWQQNVPDSCCQTRSLLFIFYICWYYIFMIASIWAYELRSGLSREKVPPLTLRGSVFSATVLSTAEAVVLDTCCRDWNTSSSRCRIHAWRTRAQLQRCCSACGFEFVLGQDKMYTSHCSECNKHVIPEHEVNYADWGDRQLFI